jgi:hypothetical protein
MKMETRQVDPAKQPDRLSVDLGDQQTPFIGTVHLEMDAARIGTSGMIGMLALLKGATLPIGDIRSGRQFPLLHERSRFTSANVNQVRDLAGAER